MAPQSYNTPLLPAVSYPTTIVEHGYFVHQDGVVLSAFVAHGIIIINHTFYLGTKHMHPITTYDCLITAQ